VDPGLLRTGFGVIEVGRGRRHRLIRFGVLAPPVRQPLERRLAGILEGLRAEIAAASPSRVAVEAIYQARNVRSALLLGHARAAALLAAALEGVPVSGYPPARVKAHVSGYGLASKQQVSFMVSRLLGLPGDLRPGDAADALALAICAADLPPETSADSPTLGPPSHLRRSARTQPLPRVERARTHS
jgi:crossover junction endodeoxyribonuclease RuvC